jgi:hypothetical protein
VRYLSDLETNCWSRLKKVEICQDQETKWNDSPPWRQNNRIDWRNWFICLM